MNIQYAWWCPCGCHNIYMSKDGKDRRICQRCKKDTTDIEVEIICTENEE